MRTTKEIKEKLFKEGKFPEYKNCSKCNKLLHFTKFYIRREPNDKVYLYSSCEYCEHVTRTKRKTSMSDEEKLEKKLEASLRHKQWRKENPEKVLENRLRLKYSIGLEEYNQLLIEQNFRCAICKIHSSELKESISVDHNHTTGEVRGLLCPQCNAGLGFFKDNKNSLLEAIYYLTKYN